jgi:hypothetical protein
MNANLRLATFLAAGIGAFGCITVFGGNPRAPDLRLINRLDEAVQHRFEVPMPASLGMSRVIRPSSFGGHFQPNMTLQRDFEPESPAEKEAIAALEQRQIQVGFYLFGATIADSEPAQLNFRALKGPGAMTRGTPRPAWYPLLATPAAPKQDTLPDWNAIYPLAREAMKSFQGGGKGFETKLATWNIAARPMTASQERCVTCHSNRAYKPLHEVRLGEAIGGVLYAFRQARD